MIQGALVTRLAFLQSIGANRDIKTSQSANINIEYLRSSLDEEFFAISSTDRNHLKCVQNVKLCPLQIVDSSRALKSRHE